LDASGILPDTCAWIDFFRQQRTRLGDLLEGFLDNEPVYACGPVLCELLQGIRSEKEEVLLLDALRALPYLEMTEQTWVEAGRLAARLRRNGKTLPFSDILLAALAREHNLSILTADRHFAEISDIEIIGL
jgi:predicted nucleic acid-binding protein